MWSVRMQLQITCPSCASQVALDALVPRLLCPRCESVVEVPEDKWESLHGTLMEDVVDVESPIHDLTAGLGSLSLTARFALEDPRLPGSGETLPAADVVAAAGAGSIFDPASGERVPVRRLEGAVAERMPAVRCVFGEDPRLLSEATAGFTTFRLPASETPRAFQCTQCGGQLTVDGTSRQVRCTFCQTTCNLPNELWQELHPFRVRPLWVILERDPLTPVTWGSTPEAVTVDRGDVFFMAFTERRKERSVLAAVRLDRTPVWIRTDLGGLMPESSSSEHVRLSTTPDGLLVVWSSEQGVVRLLSCADGSDVDLLGGDGGRPLPDGLLLGGSTCTGVVADVDGTLLACCKLPGESREVWNIVRLDLEGKRRDLWPGGGKKAGGLIRNLGLRIAEENPYRFENLGDRPERCEDEVQIQVGWDGSLVLQRFEEMRRYDRSGERVWKTKLPSRPESRPWVDEGGLTRVLCEESSRAQIHTVGPDGSCTLAVRDIREGGVLGQERTLVVTPDGRSATFGWGDAVRLLAPDGKLLWASEKARAWDEENAPHQVGLGVSEDRAVERPTGASTWMAAAFEADTSCGKCQAVLPINALAPRIACLQCGAVTKIPADLWNDLGDQLDEWITSGREKGGLRSIRSSGSLQGRRKGVYDFDIFRDAPRLSDGRTIEAEQALAALGQGGIVDPGSGKNVPVRRVPGNAGESWQEVACLVGEAEEQLPDWTDGFQQFPVPAAEKPVSYTCPHCAGALELDGRDRSVTCPYCSEAFEIPSRVWGKLHPPVRKRWYAWLDVAARPLSWSGDPLGAVCDARGTLYVLCEDQGLLLAAVDATLMPLWVRRDVKERFNLASRWPELTLAGDDRLVVWSHQKDEVVVFDAGSGELLFELGGQGRQPEGAKPLSFAGCRCLTGDRDGTLLGLFEQPGSDGSTYRLERRDLDGRSLPVWSGKGSVVGRLGGFLRRASGMGSPDRLGDRPDVVGSHDWKVRVAWDGSILLVRYGNLHRYDRSGKLVHMTEVEDAYEDPPVGDGEGNAYLRCSDPGTGYRLVRVSADGSEKTVVARHVEHGGTIQYEDVMAIRPDGALFLLDDESEMRMLDPDGRLVWASRRAAESDARARKDD